VVVITCNPTNNVKSFTTHHTDDERLKPARDLLMSLYPDIDCHNLSFGDIRNELIAINPTSIDHIRRVHEVEIEFWKHSQDTRVDSSDKILGFDCGGHQWVCEVAFPCGTLPEPNLKDIQYIERLIDLIEKNQLTAHFPIEQRWSTASSGLLSPAYHTDLNHLFTWVGIIMYLSLHDQQKRDLVTQSFQKYKDCYSVNLWDEFKVKEHWPKMEFPDDEQARQRLYKRIHQSYPTHQIISLRKELDPKEILSNPFISYLFSEHK